MTERIADSNNYVSEKHLSLYRRWSEGGCGLLISGNVMVDRFNIEGAGNIILEEKNFKNQKNMLKCESFNIACYQKRWLMILVIFGNIG